MGVTYERLKKLRENNNYTQKQVADYLGISPNTFSKMEKGRRNMNSVTLDKLCLLYNCSSEYLFGKSDDYTGNNETVTNRDRLKIPSDIEKIDLFAISKMNQVARYLKFLRKIEEEIVFEMREVGD